MAADKHRRWSIVIGNKVRALLWGGLCTIATVEDCAILAVVLFIIAIHELND